MSGQRSGDSGIWAQVAMVSGLGLVFFSSIAGGYFLGWLVDRWLGTAPIFALILGGLGMAVGLVEVLKMIKQAEKRDSGNGD